MNLNYLETFVEVVKSNSFSKAAVKLYLSQPSVSSQIKNLEGELGRRLIERGTSNLSLTHEGKRFFKFAEAVLQEYKDLITDFPQIGRSVKGKLNVVSSLIIGEFLLPKILGKYREQNPYIEISTKILDLYQIADEVKNGTNIVGLCGLKPNDYELESIKIGEDEQVLVVAPTHQLAGRKQILLSDIKAETLLLRNTPTWINQFYRTEMLKAGFDIDNYQPKLILGTVTGLVSSVESNLGIGIISHLAVKDKESAGLLKVIKIKNIDLKQDLFCVYKKSDVADPLLRDFVNFIKIWADQNFSHIESRN